MGSSRRDHEMPRRIAALLLAAFSCVLPAATQAPASAAQSSTPPALSGITRIMGDTTSATWVTVPKEARFSWRYGPNPDVTIQGGGRMAGVVITEADFSDRARRFTMAARASFCDSPGCTSDDTHQFVVGSMPGATNRDWIVLPPGRYLLYLVTDGAPVSVTLRLHGLSGKSKLLPGTPVDAEFHAPSPETEVVGPEKKAYWFGDSGTLDADAGLIAGALSIQANNWMQGTYGSCLQRDVRSPEPVAFSPACPAGTATRTTEGNPAGSGPRPIHQHSIWTVSPGGDWGLGLNYVAAADVQRAGAVTMYLPYQLPPA